MCSPAGIDSVTDGDDHIQVVEGDGLLDAINVHFLHAVLSGKLTVVKNILDVAAQVGLFFIKKKSDLTDGQPDRVILDHGFDGSAFFRGTVDQKLEIVHFLAPTTQ